MKSQELVFCSYCYLFSCFSFGSFFSFILCSFFSLPLLLRTFCSSARCHR